MVKLFGQVPSERITRVPGARIFVIGAMGKLDKVLLPVLQPLLLHPQGIMLPGVRLVGMHTRRLDMVEAIPGTVEIAPIVQILKERLPLNRLAAWLRFKRLKVRLADQDRLVAVLLKESTHRRHILG